MHHLSFSQALIEAESQARKTLPSTLHERLAHAAELVRGGRVFQDSDGGWQVESASQAGLTYSVNGACQCSDHHYNHPPQGLCKHRLSMFLSQRVMTLMQQPPAPVIPVPACPEILEPFPDNDDEPCPAPLPEAPCSCNVYVMVSGHKVQVTLRDRDEQRMLGRLQILLKQYPAPQPVPQPPSPGQEGTPRCPTHGALKRSTKGKGWYCPTKLDDDTWCPSKGRQ
jgi:hypothetical protein